MTTSTKVNEIFLPVKNYPNYKVSNLGTVKRVKCNITYANGKIANYPEKILKPEISKGYQRVTLSKNNTQKRFQVHRLVANHFLNNTKNKKCVNHKDGNKLNNKVSNLEWVSYSENEKQSYDVLNKVNPQRKLNSGSVKDIRVNAVKGKKGNINHFADKYNVDRSTILNTLNEKYYV